MVLAKAKCRSIITLARGKGGNVMKFLKYAYMIGLLFIITLCISSCGKEKPKYPRYKKEKPYTIMRYDSRDDIAWKK